MILKDLGDRYNYEDAMVNKVRPYGQMMMVSTKQKMVKLRIDLEYKEVEKDLFKIVKSEENMKKIQEAELSWGRLKDYHFDAGWFEKIIGLEGAIKLV